jgi:hypothetical protein
MSRRDEQLQGLLIEEMMESASMVNVRHYTRLHWGAWHGLLCHSHLAGGVISSCDFSSVIFPYVSLYTQHIKYDLQRPPSLFHML